MGTSPRFYLFTSATDRTGVHTAPKYSTKPIRYVTLHRRGARQVRSVTEIAPPQCINPLSPKRDQPEISSYNINALENIVVMRIEYMIREDESN